VTVRTPALRPGDRVAVVSPAGPADAERLERGMEMLRSWGFVPELGKHALARHGYLAGPDADRLTDLEWALGDTGIRAVIASRGGYGTQRIVDAPVWSRLRSDPKLLVGFSDITALHLAAWNGAGVASLYAPGAAWDADRLGDSGAASLHSAMTSTQPVIIHGTAAAGGVATGPLLGGNLSLLAASVGAGLPSLRDAVVLIEEVDEAPYRIDRMLTQLRRSGALDGIAGVAVGQMTNCSSDDAVAAVLHDRLGDLGVPVLSGLPIGHGPGQLTVPLGSEARLDVAAGILHVASAVG
jgi:muramoyltetrapeptide carboxypeptidase